MMVSQSIKYQLSSSARWRIYEVTQKITLHPKNCSFKIFKIFKTFIFKIFSAVFLKRNFVKALPCYHQSGNRRFDSISKRWKRKENEEVEFLDGEEQEWEVGESESENDEDPLIFDADHFKEIPYWSQSRRAKINFK